VEINNALIAEPFYTQYCYYTQDSFGFQSQVVMGHLFANVVMLVVILSFTPHHVKNGEGSIHAANL